MPEQTTSRLAKLREAAGLTQQELADAARVTQANVSLYERGLKAPTLVTLKKLCAVLGVSLSEFDAAE